MKVLDIDGSGWAANLVAAAILATLVAGVAAGAELLFGARFDLRFNYGVLWAGWFTGEVIVGWVARGRWDVEPPSRGRS